MVYVKKSYWVKKLKAIVHPAPVVAKKKKCEPGPDGKPCFAVGPTKFVGKEMTRSHTHYAVKPKKAATKVKVSKATGLPRLVAMRK